MKTKLTILLLSVKLLVPSLVQAETNSYIGKDFSLTCSALRDKVDPVTLIRIGNTLTTNDGLFGTRTFQITNESTFGKYGVTITTEDEDRGDTYESLTKRAFRINHLGDEVRTYHFTASITKDNNFLTGTTSKTLYHCK